MTSNDYFSILELSPGSSVDEIKKAYRIKARQFHPDINHDPDARDKFIAATEAYDFLLSNYEKIVDEDEVYRKTMEDWRKYRQDRSKQRARAYSQTSYIKFSNTRFYRSTRIFDGTTVIFSLLISVVMIVITIYGYDYRLKNPLPDYQNPTFLTFLMLLLLGLVFFVLSLVFLKTYIDSSNKRKKKSK
jgi:hypothetical protein